MHARCMRSPDVHCVLRKWRALLRTRFNFLPSPVMPNYCSLLGCTATLSFTVAIAAQSTPATKPAITAHPIEAAPKAVPAKVQKETAAKTPAPPKEPAITFNSVHVDEIGRASC